MAKYFYIYALMDGLVPYYIGKGSGSRKVQHFRGLPPQDKVEGSSEKHQRIAKIKSEGRVPHALVLGHYATESAALAAETQTIDEIGLENLTNMNGGGGGHKAKVTPNHDHKRAFPLTHRQESFAQAVAKGLNYTEAYRAAGYAVTKKTPKSINECASRLANDIKIVSRIEQLRAPAVQAAEITVEYIVRGFKNAVELAEETGNAGAMTGAYKEIGKISDLYPAERQEVNVNNDALTEALRKGRDRSRGAIE